MQDDPIRQLEFDLGIKVENTSSHCCRFCKTTLQSKYNMPRHLKICKQKEIYHQQLILQKEQQPPASPIQTPQVIPEPPKQTLFLDFNQKSNTKGVTTKLINDIIEQCKPIKHLIYKACTASTKFKILLNTLHPENNNVIISSHRSPVGHYRDNGQWKVCARRLLISLSIKKSAGELLQQLKMGATPISIAFEDALETLATTGIGNLVVDPGVAPGGEQMVSNFKLEQLRTHHTLALVSPIRVRGATPPAWDDPVEP
jgi:hypothetical protein